MALTACSSDSKCSGPFLSGDASSQGEATAWPNCSVGPAYCMPDNATAPERMDWVRIPPEKIVPDHAPDGRAYLFMFAGAIQCFVRPKGDF